MAVFQLNFKLFYCWSTLKPTAERHIFSFDISPISELNYLKPTFIFIW